MLEFSLSGFLFAVVNFLILVGLLYKFLHKPLLAVLDKRRHDIEQAQEETARKQAEAAASKRQYEEKMAALETTRDKLLADARHAAEARRDELLEKAREQAKRDVANFKRDWQRQERDAVEAMQDRLAGAALALADKILRQVSDQTVETELRKRLCAKLEALDAAELGAQAPETPVLIVSAQPLDEETQAELGKRVRTAAGETVEIRFRADESLLAGCRVEFVERAVDASLAEALAGLRTALSRSFGERAGREEVKAAAAGPGDHDATPPTATESAPATPAQAEPKE